MSSDMEIGQKKLNDFLFYIVQESQMSTEA